MDYTRIQCHTKPDMEKVFNGCSDPEFAFSNVPQKSVNVLENFERSLRVHYPQRIIFHEKHSQRLELDYVGWNICVEQNNLQILLPGYEKHFTISNDK